MIVVVCGHGAPNVAARRGRWKSMAARRREELRILDAPMRVSFDLRLLGAAALLILVPHAASAQQRVDLLIRGGSVYDGTSAPPRRVDVAVSGDRILYVGDHPGQDLSAARVIDAARLVVAPGFIDPHTHPAGGIAMDFGRADVRTLLPFVSQGVTTVVVGNDGGGPFEVAEMLARLERDGIGANVAFLVGHGTIRRKVLGMADRAPSPAELEQMRSLVERGIREGGFGFSTGLYYAPGSYARTDEVVALAKVAARLGAYYDSHIRDESSYTIGLLGAVDETLRIGREAGIPVHFAHIKALGVDVWGQSAAVIAKIRAARTAGQRVTADQYPYIASGSGVGSALLPRWAEAGGRDSLLRRLRDPELGRRIRAEMADNLRRRGGAGSLLLTAGRWSGQRLDRIAEVSGTNPVEAAVTIIEAGDAAVASFNMDERDVERFMAQDFVVTGSDGSDGHPRKFGTFPRKLREYALTRRVITMARAIEASSGQTAAIVGLADRGTIVAGNFADLVVFDSTRIADQSTFEEPRRTSAGVEYVVVNGRLAVDRGRPTGMLAGRALRKRPAP